MAHLRGFEPLYASVDQSSQKLADGLGCYDFIQKTVPVFQHMLWQISVCCKFMDISSLLFGAFIRQGIDF